MADAPALPWGRSSRVFPTGYLVDGRVLRFAEVKVAGGPLPDTGGSDGCVIVGIDLGTTNPEVAAPVEGNVQVLAVEGEQIMPLASREASPDGTPLVGTLARNQYVVYPERTVKSIKRKMGQDVKSSSLGDQEYRPAGNLGDDPARSRTARRAGRPVRRAVITVPAYFNDAQRQATREAGELAGLEVVRILNEPTAASLTYDPSQSELQRMLVYDLGGGTFDVSIVQAQEGVVEVLASHGDTQLGGDDFDDCCCPHPRLRPSSRPSTASTCAARTAGPRRGRRRPRSGSASRPLHAPATRSSSPRRRAVPCTSTSEIGRGGVRGADPPAARRPWTACSGPRRRRQAASRDRQGGAGRRQRRTPLVGGCWRSGSASRPTRR